MPPNAIVVLYQALLMASLGPLQSWNPFQLYIKVEFVFFSLHYVSGNCSPTPRYIPNRTACLCLPKTMFWDVHGDLLLMSPNWKPPKHPATGWRMDSDVLIPWKTAVQ